MQCIVDETEMALAEIAQRLAGSLARLGFVAHSSERDLDPRRRDALRIRLAGV